MSEDRAQWRTWTDQVCEKLDLDTDVDIDGVLDLTSEVAHRFLRPMAPVAAYLVGLAVAAGTPFAEAVAAVEETLPEKVSE